LGAEYYYTDWETADAAVGTAQGTITLPDDSIVTVTFVATNEDGSAGTLHGAQVDGGTNYWSPDTPYISAEVENPPPTPDLLQLAGGLNQTYEVTLSEPIKDPVMAIVSLGAPGIRTTYDFDSPFTIVSQGAGYWGGNDTALAALPDDILEGYEGHGTIRFIGTFARFSWTVPTTESWHGFTFAVRTTEAIEPTPTEGGAGGVGNDAGAGGVGDGAGAGGVSGGGIGGAIATDGGAGASGGVAGEGVGGGTEAAGATAGGSGGRGGSAAGGEGGAVSPPAGGSAGEDDEEVDKDDEEGETRCHCSVPGATSRSFASAIALLAVAVGGMLRRRRRAR
jgi:hypothetical protein